MADMVLSELSCHVLAIPYITNTYHDFATIIQTKHICVFVLKLAKYDQSYDIRDRARMVNALLFTKVVSIHK